MKKSLFILFSLTLVFSVMNLSGCQIQEEKNGSTEAPDKVINRNVSIVEIDGHSYVLFSKNLGSGGAGGICHSESCSCKTK